MKTIKKVQFELVEVTTFPDHSDVLVKPVVTG